MSCDVGEATEGATEGLANEALLILQSFRRRFTYVTKHFTYDTWRAAHGIGPICTVDVWTGSSKLLFISVHEGVIITKPCSAKGLLHFTEEVIITQCQIRAVTWVFQYCASNFSDLSGGFVTDK